MNYNSLIFRKDMTGVDENVKWSGITADLMRAYLYSQRSIINGYHIFAMMENCYQRRMFWMLSIDSLGFIRDIWREGTISIRLVIMMEY